MHLIIIRTLFTLLLTLLANYALAQQQTEAPLVDQLYFLAKHYAARVEILEKKVEELTEKCGDKCIAPTPSKQ